jgi:hypothetical protein
VKVALICVGISVLAFFLFVPAHMDHSGYRPNESAAIGMLRRMVQLEDAYAVAHPDTGHTCDLSLLLPKTDAEYGLDMLIKGKWSGYTFEVSGCESDDHGIVRHYRVTAVPQQQGVTGGRAFCTDESGTVFYDVHGLAANCWAERRELGR